MTMRNFPKETKNLNLTCNLKSIQERNEFRSFLDRNAIMKSDLVENSSQSSQIGESRLSVFEQLQ